MKITYNIHERAISVDHDTDFIRIEIDGHIFTIQETLNGGELRIEKPDNELTMSIKGQSHIIIN